MAAAVGGSVIGWQLFRVARARAELQTVLAELDRDEPGWRIEAIEAARAPVPDDENNVPVILRARSALPRLRNEDQDELRAMLAGLSPNVRLTDVQYDFCIGHLETMEAAVSLVGRVTRMPRGHCPIDHSPGALSPLVLVNKARWLQFWPTQLLVLVDAHDGDSTAGLRMCVANLHIAAAIGDEPVLVCQWCRSRHVGAALDGLERLLGQGEIQEANLVAFQAKLAAEAEHDPWPIGLRGDRASHHNSLDALARGAISLSSFRQGRQGAPGSTGWSARAKDWLADRIPVHVAEADTWMLRRWTQLLRDTTTAPWHERAKAVAGFDADQAEGPPLARLNVNSYVSKLFDYMQCDQGRLRCAMAAIAAERYRMRYGEWPAKLDQVVRELLAAVPVDPFDGDHVRFRRLPDGVVIFTVGPDGADDGGHLATGIPPPAGTDIGIRLWDPARRRQPPP